MKKKINSKGWGKRLLDFLFKRRRKSSNNLPPKGRIGDPSQRQLDVFQMPPQEKQRLPIQVVSIRQIESEVKSELKDFQSYVKEMKDISLKLEELTKLLKSREVSENMYGLIMNELSGQLSILIEEIFKLGERLKLAKAKARLEWAKEKIGLTELETPERQVIMTQSYHDYFTKRELYSPLYKWEEIISKIDAVLSSLTMKEELSIIEQYLYLIKEKLSLEAGLERMEKGMETCQQRLNLISERWVSIRHDKIEQIMNLELKASRIKEEMKEFEVRFAVGEFSQSAYENKMSTLRGSLKEVEKEFSDIRNYIDDMDMKVFKCSELLRKKP